MISIKKSTKNYASSIKLDNDELGVLLTNGDSVLNFMSPTQDSHYIECGAFEGQQLTIERKAFDEKDKAMALKAKLKGRTKYFYAMLDIDGIATLCKFVKINTWQCKLLQGDSELRLEKTLDGWQTVHEDEPSETQQMPEVKQEEAA